MADMRKLSVSNIAWPQEEDEAAIALAGALGFTGIELAPGKVFSGWSARDEARAYRRRLAERGLAIPAFQALTFGMSEMSVFGPKDARDRLADHLCVVARLAEAAGAGACVFGSPKLRDPGELSSEAAFDHAVDFFGALAPAFADAGVTLAFEANAAAYGCRFATHTLDAVALAKAVNAPGFGVQLDTGTILMNDEPVEVVGEAAPFAAHFHASEPLLATLASAAQHRALGARLNQTGYGGWRSIEMQAVPDWRGALRQAGDLFMAAYA